MKNNTNTYVKLVAIAAALFFVAAPALADPGHADTEAHTDAEAATSGSETSAAADAAIQADAGITPDSALYGLDKAWDRARLAFTFNEANRADVALEIAQERLEETREVQGNAEARAEARQNHAAALQQAQQSLEKAQLGSSEEAATRLATVEKKLRAHQVSVEEVEAAVQQTSQVSAAGEASGEAGAEQQENETEDDEETVEKNLRKLQETISEKRNRTAAEMRRDGRSQAEVQATFREAADSTGLNTFLQTRAEDRLARADACLSASAEVEANLSVEQEAQYRHLINVSRQHKTVAEAALENEVYGKAFGRATASWRICEAAEEYATGDVPIDEVEDEFNQSQALVKAEENVHISVHCETPDDHEVAPPQELQERREEILRQISDLQREQLEEQMPEIDHEEYTVETGDSVAFAGHTFTLVNVTGSDVDFNDSDNLSEEDFRTEVEYRLNGETDTAAMGERIQVDSATQVTITSATAEDGGSATLQVTTRTEADVNTTSNEERLQELREELQQIREDTQEYMRNQATNQSNLVAEVEVEIERTGLTEETEFTLDTCEPGEVKAAIVNRTSLTQEEVNQYVKALGAEARMEARARAEAEMGGVPPVDVPRFEARSETRFRPPGHARSDVLYRDTTGSTTVVVVGNVAVSADTRQTVQEFVDALDNVNSEVELEFEAEKEDGEVSADSSVEGELSADQQQLWTDTKDALRNTVENADVARARIKIEIEHEPREDEEDDLDEERQEDEEEEETAETEGEADFSASGETSTVEWELECDDEVSNEISVSSEDNSSIESETRIQLPDTNYEASATVDTDSDNREATVDITWSETSPRNVSCATRADADVEFDVEDGDWTVTTHVLVDGSVELEDTSTVSVGVNTTES